MDRLTCLWLRESGGREGPKHGHQMGYIHWPLLFSLLAVVGLSLSSAMGVCRGDATADLRTKAWIDTVLFWGGFALIAGILGTLVGFIIAAQSIGEHGEGDPALRFPPGASGRSGTSRFGHRSSPGPGFLRE